MAASGPLRAENCSIASLFIQQFHNSAWPLREKKTSPQFISSFLSLGAQPKRRKESMNLRKFALKESKVKEMKQRDGMNEVRVGMKTYNPLLRN